MICQVTIEQALIKSYSTIHQDATSLAPLVSNMKVSLMKSIWNNTIQLMSQRGRQNEAKAIATLILLMRNTASMY